MPWTADDLPDLADRTFIVTGGNSGIGFEAARALAGANARVLLACRSRAKAGEALARMRAEHPGAALEALDLDLASLASVRAFAREFLARGERLDVLLNNAGVMALPACRTADGFEMQLGTNHLGHFALTGLLLERLLETPGARVVNVSSDAHRFGWMDFDDPNWQRRRYRKWRAYGQSKLANLLFTYALQRRLERAGKSPGLLAAACHPGYAATNLQAAGPRMQGSGFLESAFDVLNRVFAQSAPMGALPSLYAAAHPDVQGGDYIGPDGLLGGHPKKVRSSRRSRDAAAAERLWRLSEDLTGVRYDALA